MHDYIYCIAKTKKPNGTNEIDAMSLGDIEYKVLEVQDCLDVTPSIDYINFDRYISLQEGEYFLSLLKKLGAEIHGNNFTFKSCDIENAIDSLQNNTFEPYGPITALSTFDRYGNCEKVEIHNFIHILKYNIVPDATYSLFRIVDYHC